MELRMIRRQRDRPADQVQRCRRIAALLAQYAEQMQRIGVVGRGLQVCAIRLFGGVELAGLVEVKGFLQGHGQKGDIHGRAPGGTLCRSRPRGASCQVGYYSDHPDREDHKAAIHGRTI